MQAEDVHKCLSTQRTRSLTSQEEQDRNNQGTQIQRAVNVAVLLERRLSLREARQTGNVVHNFILLANGYIFIYIYIHTVTEKKLSIKMRTC